MTLRVVCMYRGWCDIIIFAVADSLKEIFQSLQGLGSPEKNSHNWEES